MRAERKQKKKKGKEKKAVAVAAGDGEAAILRIHYPPLLGRWLPQ